jgi:hypothetical protein
MPFKPLHIRLTIHVPATLERLVVYVGLLFRRLWYGYSVRLIPVGQGRYAIVDADDYERLAKYKWQVRSKGHTFYAFRYSSTRGGKKSRRILMHREIIDIPEGLVCDHRNRRALDNRKANLRPATVSQNNCNVRKRGQRTSRYRGVSQAARSNKWRAQIGVNGRSINLGTFDDKVDAAKAYDTAAKKYHGEFAVLNFPDRPPSRLRLLAGWFFAGIAGRWKRSLRTSPKSSPPSPRAQSNDVTSPRAKSRGLLKQISPLASPSAALRAKGWFGRNDNTACDIFSAKHKFSICGFFEQISKNLAKVRETCENLIEIVRKCAIMNTLQMARGP